jgi:kinesin family protein 2/24
VQIFGLSEVKVGSVRQLLEVSDPDDWLDRPTGNAFYSYDKTTRRLVWRSPLLTCAARSASRQVIQTGQEQRSVGSTAMNAHSSRSHAVLQIALRTDEEAAAAAAAKDAAPVKVVSRNPRVERRGAAARGAWCLRGSDHGCESGNRHEPPTHNTNIDGCPLRNDLLDRRRRAPDSGPRASATPPAAPEVIRALDRKADHMPFRGSKLTQVLKSSLIGDGARS